MSLFRPFEPNPFRVNAFTITGVGLDVLRSADIDAEVKARADEIDVDREYSIALAGGASHKVATADLTQSEEVLRDPNRRHCEELLVPRPYPVAEPPAIAVFRRRHTLTPKAADAQLSAEPLNATGLLVRSLPPAAVERVVPSRDQAPWPPAEPVRCPPIAMLVRLRDRHG